MCSMTTGRVTSAVSATSATLPSRRTVMRSQTPTTSSRGGGDVDDRFWSAARRRIASIRVSISAAARDAVGSSRMRMLASCEIALAISTSCRDPTGSCSTSRRTSMSAPRRARAVAARRSTSASSIRRSHPLGSWLSMMLAPTDIAGMRLNSWNTIAIPGRPADLAAGRPVPASRHAAARVGDVCAVEDLDQCRFPGTVLADQAMNFAAPQGEVHLMEHLDPC